MRETQAIRWSAPTCAPPSRVELLGEMTDWLTAIPLERLAEPADAPDGSDPAAGRCHSPVCFETRLDLPEGLYQYQVAVDGVPRLDPSCARTRSQAGRRNSVLSVGGTEEPLLFAPSSGCIWLEEPGLAVVQALLRRGHGDRATVCWDVGGTDRLDHRAGMTPVAEEDEHLVLRARVPFGCSRGVYRFELGDGAIRGARGTPDPFVWDAAVASPRVSSRWQDAVFYTIFVDRFRPDVDQTDWTARGGRNVGAGGHLDGIARSLPELVDLGVTVLYLTPVHLAESCHRYDLVDPRRVDPALGGDDAFRRLVQSAHAAGLRVLLDLSFSHAGRGFPPYEDVLQHGRSSPHAGMFLWEPGPDGGLRYYGRRQLSPLLDPSHPDVRGLALEAARHWIELGVDGFRLDAAADVPHELARALRAELLRARPEGIVLGEVVPAHAWRWIDEECVDLATDFGFHEALTAFVAERSLSADQAWQRIVQSEIARGGSDGRHVRFLSTHDHPRFATLCRRHDDLARVGLGTLLWLSSAGLPSLLYGEEVGLSADVAVLEPEAVWEDRAPMPWGASERDGQQRALVRRLLELRAGAPALTLGRSELAFADGPVMVLRRSGRGETLDVAVNASDEPVELDLEDDDLDALTPLTTTGPVRIEGSTVALGPNGGLLARRSRSEARQRALGREIRDSSQRIDRSFAEGRPDGPLRPRRIDWSITERCNLRCRHCIDASPTRTADGIARVMPHAVLDAIRDDLAFASTFAFVHGGESLTTDMLWHVLEAIRQSRQAPPTTVHLLSNGMLLDLDSVKRFAALGGTSLAVSVDGARASTNDAVREGGRLERVWENVGAAVRWRTHHEVDLRIGLSVVVMACNVDELAELMDRAAELGVDWVKLEELVPSTPFARSQQLPLRSGELDERIARAAALGRAAGLVVVEHVAPPTVWRCELSAAPAMATFVEADEYAHRTTIHPCRAAWEHACIDPSGDVRVGDFWGPAIGNVLVERLSAIWSGPLAHAERERAAASWPCKGRPAGCA